MSETQKINSQTPQEELAALLESKPELRDKLIEALETDRFFLTLSFQKKAKPQDPHDLQHFWHREKFNTGDVIPSLKHHAADYNAKENPMGVRGDGDDWH